MTDPTRDLPPDAPPTSDPATITGTRRAGDPPRVPGDPLAAAAPPGYELLERIGRG